MCRQFPRTKTDSLKFAALWAFQLTAHMVLADPIGKGDASRCRLRTTRHTREEADNSAQSLTLHGAVAAKSAD